MMLFDAVLVGLGATLMIDLWALLLRRVSGIRSLDYRMLGRWLLHMTQGSFVHANIGATASKPHERVTGWIAHYSIGAGLAIVFVLMVSREWLAQPTLLPALLFGVATVIVPFSTLQPAFGLGFAASKAPAPWQARLKSVMTHAVFGVGLWLWAELLNRVAA